MTIGQSMLGEFDQEMQNTRKTLERVPDDKWDWKPHEKSGTLGWMAGHVATLPGFTVAVSTSSEYDVVTAKPLKVDKEADLVGLFIKMSGEARQALAGSATSSSIRLGRSSAMVRLLLPCRGTICC